MQKVNGASILFRRKVYYQVYGRFLNGELNEKIVVLGCGLVGRVIAEDLSTNFDVTSIDFSQKNLDKISVKKINKKFLDLQDPVRIKNVVKDFELVVGALPGDMGFEAMKQVVLSKKDVVDISFFPEAICLRQLAKENNVTAIMDCGVAG